MKFNAQIILNMVKPHVINDTLTYEAFDRLFPMLPRREQYTVADILAENGIELRDGEDAMASAFADVDDARPAPLTAGAVFGGNDDRDFLLALQKGNLSNGVYYLVPQQRHQFFCSKIHKISLISP